MIAFWKNSQEIADRIYIPKYYDPKINADLETLSSTHVLHNIGKMIQTGGLSVSTGDEIGKMAYGTGEIPFVRTSDISNWEIKSAPKQGVSEEFFSKYNQKQDVRPGDILLVRDGTYLIGTNCFVTSLDTKLIYQSHILKFRLTKTAGLDPHLFFLALNSDIVQRQMRSMQFTADTIDTIGNRYLDVLLPVPKSSTYQIELARETRRALSERVKAKAFVKQAPYLIEKTLKSGDASAIYSFLSKDLAKITDELVQDTVTAEFGNFGSFWLKSNMVKERILLPKYYDPEISRELKALEAQCDCRSISELVGEGVLGLSTGDEIGKMAYGTGNVPFIRTSDFSNWEIKHDPKQSVSGEIYKTYAEKQDLQTNDILLVRDGTYLVGNSCIVTELDKKALFCGGLYKIRSYDQERLSPFLILGLLNSYIVKRQMRTKQFTRDVIDTLGQRLKEVVLPIPRSPVLREEMAQAICGVVHRRVEARQHISNLSRQIEFMSIPM